MLRKKTGNSVFDEALDRVIKVYEGGHRIVVSFSGGKDSTCTLELCRVAANITGAGPVDVIMRDDEIMLPGTFEYAKRIAMQSDISFNWIVQGQPVINVFNRINPYFWCFDPLIPEEDWVRKPPAGLARREPEISIRKLITPAKYPPAPGKDVFNAMGVRADESAVRLVSIVSSKGHITKHDEEGVRRLRPIYDWGDGDVWKAIGENKWDYNKAYDVMARTGVPRKSMRIAPPSQNVAAIPIVQMASQAWPTWFDKVCQRLPGFRSVANYGHKVVSANRRSTETWEQCFERTCIETAPPWIAERSRKVREMLLEKHAKHSTAPFPEIKPCLTCNAPGISSWRSLARAMYLGDPFSLKCRQPYMEPEYFRAGAGRWGGKPSF
jgi:predicted phosphoadenosine phosphosulfate sulfurtransferase